MIPKDTDFAIKTDQYSWIIQKFQQRWQYFIGKDGSYSKKVFYVPSLSLGSFVSSVFYGSGTSVTDMTEIYLYDLLNSKYKLVDHLTNESIELRNKMALVLMVVTWVNRLMLNHILLLNLKIIGKYRIPFSKSRILF